MSRHRQVEARLADVGLHAVNRLAGGSADHFRIKQLDDIWSSSRWGKEKNEQFVCRFRGVVKIRDIVLELNILLANVITSSNEP